MARNEVTQATISNDIEHVIQSNADANPQSLAREIADELSAKYEIRRKPPVQKTYKDKPKGGRIW
jgi:hypothetical protein